MKYICSLRASCPVNLYEMYFLGIIKAGRSVDREVSAEYNLIVRAGNDYCGVNRTGEDTGMATESL